MADNNLQSALSMEYQAPNPVNSALSMEYESPPKPKDTTPNPAAAPTKTQKFTQGLGDTEYGVGQLIEHTPVLNTITRGWRELIQQGLKTAGFGQAAEMFDPAQEGDPTSGDLTDQKAASKFDDIVRTREQQYQSARQAAGETGIDWWRLGGNAANPINYLSPGNASASALGRIGQGAIQGAMINAEQPTQTPGSYWWDKTKNMAGGALVGGTVSAAVEAAIPVLRAGAKIAKNVLGNNAADTTAAESVVNDALRAKSIDPNSVDLNVLSGMKQEVKDALDSGTDISQEAIVNRAKAESLPVPIRLMKGQATGDPMLFSQEQNLRGITGVGEPLTQRLQEQNQGFIQNLDAMGAKDAPDTVSSSNMIANKVQGFWDGLQQQKTQLYDAVKNSQGLSAKLDNVGIGQEIRETLGSPESGHSWMLLPANIQETVRDLEEDKLDLTVSQLQALDKSWGQAAAGASDGSTAHAINQARQILGDAKITDDAGQEAMQAYQAARQAHAQQMSLLEPKLLNGMPNPNYQPLVKSVVMDGKLDDVFQKGFMGASPSEAGKSLAFLEQVDPDMDTLVGKTMMGEIKRQALSSASDERGTVSQAVLNGWARDPVKSARMDAILPKELVGTFRNLADTVEVAKRVPVAGTVNTSNTGSAVVNAAASALKQGATAKLLGKIPLVGDITPVIQAAKTESAVQGALNPGVTLKSLLGASPKQAATNRLLSQLLIPAAAIRTPAPNQSTNKPPD